MEIKLLSSVLHDGTIHARDEILDLEEVSALSLVAAGAAKPVEKPAATDPVTPEPGNTPASSGADPKAAKAAEGK